MGLELLSENNSGPILLCYNTAYEVYLWALKIAAFRQFFRY